MKVLQCRNLSFQSPSSNRQQPGRKPWTTQKGCMDREYAKQIFTHYFKLIGEKAGAKIDSDCISEIESAVDAIYEDAVYTAKAHTDKAIKQLSQSTT